MDWVDVPNEAVITEPNRAGRTMVWPRQHDLSASLPLSLSASVKSSSLHRRGDRISGPLAAARESANGV
jgi:hypothetical protein